MKCIHCEICGDVIIYGDHVWQVDSVFEQEIKVCCDDCASDYQSYKDAIKLLAGDKYNDLNWFDMITDWRSQEDLDWYIPEKTLSNAAELIARLALDYKIDESHILEMTQTNITAFLAMNDGQSLNNK